MLFSMASKPMLGEWTARAQRCDMLNEPVISRNNISKYCFYAVLMFLNTFTGQSCHGWEVHWSFRFLPICTEGKISIWYNFLHCHGIILISFCWITNPFTFRLCCMLLLLAEGNYSSIGCLPVTLKKQLP